MLPGTFQAALAALGQRAGLGDTNASDIDTPMETERAHGKGTAKANSPPVVRLEGKRGRDERNCSKVSCPSL